MERRKFTPEFKLEAVKLVTDRGISARRAGKDLGIRGKAGVMPPKGGRTDLPDDLIKQGVDYMVSLAQ
jgi:cytochrome c5